MKWTHGALYGPTCERATPFRRAGLTAQEVEIKHSRKHHHATGSQSSLNWHVRAVLRHSYGCLKSVASCAALLASYCVSVESLSRSDERRSGNGLCREECLESNHTRLSRRNKWECWRRMGNGQWRPRKSRRGGTENEGA